MLWREMRGGATASGLPGGQLLGRQREREVIDRLLAAARGGDGGVLVMYGEPGVGKTALVDYSVEAARGFRVARALGVEGEMELPFAALQQFCAPFLELSERLPEPQREALAVAFGLSAGPAASPFFVGLAVLGLLSEAAEERPLFGVVDDAQWLDRASARALTFVARRLLAERIALMFATRELSAFAGFPELHVEALGRRDARALLDSVLSAPLDDPVAERIVAETRGNPLALLELPRGLSPSQLAGGFGLPAAEPLSASIEESYARRLADLPIDAGRLLLVAAADPGRPRAALAGRRGPWHSRGGAETVEAEDLLTLGPRVGFGIRWFARPCTVPPRRRNVARYTAPLPRRPTRRPIPTAARGTVPKRRPRLTRRSPPSFNAPRRARRPGAASPRPARSSSAVRVTLDGARRATRALAAAEAYEQAGALDAALALIATAQPGPLDEFQRARVDVLRARISFDADRGREAPGLLFAAAQRLEPLDGGRAREIYLDALTAAMFAGRLGGATDARRWRPRCATRRCR